MKRISSDKEYKAFIEDLELIHSKVHSMESTFKSEKGDPIRNFLKKNMKSEMSDKDFERVVDLIVHDSVAKHSVGAQSLYDIKSKSDANKNEFLKMAMILTSDKLSEETKQVTQDLLNTNDKIPYSTIVKEATVQGVFDVSESDVDIPFKKSMNRKLSIQHCIYEACENASNSESAKNFVKGCAPFMSFSPKVNETGMGKLTQAFLNITQNVSECGDSEIIESFKKKVNQFIQDSFSFPNDSKTGGLFKDLVEINDNIHKLEVSKQFEENIRESENETQILEMA